MSLVGIGPLDAQTGGLVYSEDTVLTVEDGTVLVEISATMTNTSTDRVEGNTVFYSFFDLLPMVLPVGAGNVTASSRGSTLSSTSTPIDDDFELLEFELPTRLRAGQSRTVSVSYELPEGEPRTNGLFISNPAYASFPLWSFSDPGQGSIQLRIPAEAQLNDIGASLRSVEDQEAYSVFEPEDFAVPQDLFAYVAVTDPSELETRLINVAGQDIEINYWPTDLEWANFADRTITSGLPVLEDLIGFDIPEQSTLEVNESATPYFFGYGGWYDELATSIDIGNVLDETVMLHELSHAWFNRDLFVDRWITEGLAEDLTWRAQGELGSDQESVPAVPRLTDRGALPLSEWTAAEIGVTNSEDFRDSELYSYEASWFMVRSIVDTIGFDDMQAMIIAAEENRQAYSASSSLVLSPGEDWRRFLDLVSDHATPEEADVIEALFVEFVAAEEDLPDFEDRSAARISFEILSERDPGWDVPLALRNAMALWDFESAETFLEQARPIQDRYLQIEAAIEGTTIEISNAGQTSYEAGPAQWDSAIQTLDEQLRAAEVIVAAQDGLSGPLPLRQRVGLWGADTAGPVEEARAALAVDDFDGVNNAMVDLQQTLVAAGDSGGRRLGIGGGILAFMLVILFGSRRRRASTNKDGLDGEDPEEGGLSNALGILEGVSEEPAI